MKARVKATGEIVDVEIKYFGRYSTYVDEKGVMYKRLDDLDFDVSENHTGNATNDPDYWTRLEHQYAGMAMAGICANPSYDEASYATMADDAIRAAHALAEKIKQKEE